MKRLLATAGALAVLVTGCGAETPDYKSIWTTSATTPAAPADNQPVPLWQYLEDSGVVGEPIAPEKIPHLTVTMPTPAGWHTYNNPNLAPGTRMIAKGDTYPTAMMLAFKLHGEFDVPKALKEHGYADAQLSENFKQLNASNADWKGFPSAMIEGSYDLNGKRMQSYNRVVIANDGLQPPQRYLVQLTVTTYAEEAAAQGPDIESIIAGFNIAKK
ncbi:LpqN/LpqT family lipoprotein [Mycolicibacterium neworleansense]|uniref:LpqT protein n=1 Tax=Mycolicibacterium neworleansense TaxID=146018 RepID=A0A0H5RWH0_9MYCO|nr:LpqN/LpqT family lipoprotein [Mycolicibacterium neworleansense]MCV7360966.1 LpqN/LpqT family lipoprotein [Mycolicibacterium neworleansense]CRZ18465.1 LpqT protein [Mycolicibacterium neworleansense]